MNKLEFSCHKSNGKFTIRNRKLLDEALERLGEGEYELVIQKQKVVRSDSQNKMYWGLIIPQLQVGFRDIGYDWSKENCHDFIKTNFNYTERLDEKTDKMYRIPLSTARLTKSEFSALCEKIFQFASEYLNIIIETPTGR